MSHVPQVQLLAFTLGQLDPAQREPIAAHLESCESCRNVQASLSAEAFAKTAVGSPGLPTRPEGPNPALPLARGATLGRYVLLGKLGAGFNGRPWRQSRRVDGCCGGQRIDNGGRSPFTLGRQLRRHAVVLALYFQNQLKHQRAANRPAAINQLFALDAVQELMQPLERDVDLPRHRGCGKSHFAPSPLISFFATAAVPSMPFRKLMGWCINTTVAFAGT
jgi:Putative zinc-finger